MKSYEINVLARYLILLCLVFILLSNFFLDLITVILSSILYVIFIPFGSTFSFDSIIFNEITFLIVEECIAPSAYILISFVFLTLPLKLNKILKIVFSSYVVFTLFNLIRMIFLILIFFMFGEYYFDSLHLIFYQFLSGIVTALIIIYYLRKEKIKKIYPVISDTKNLFEFF